MDNVVKSVGKLGAALANPAIARDCVAGSTGLEPAASGVTGRRSNQTELQPRFLSMDPKYSIYVMDCQYKSVRSFNVR